MSIYNFTAHLSLFEFGVMAVRDTKLRSSLTKNILSSRDS